MVHKIFSIILILTMLLQPVASAQTGTSLGASATTGSFLKGIKIYPQEPLKIDLLIENSTHPSSISHEGYFQLAQYFLTALTVPDGDLWVNLSPKDPDRVIASSLEQTDMGRDLLYQDYVLKQLTAALLSPNQPQGREFWDTVYQKAYERFGIVDLPMESFHRVWIVPDKAVLYQAANTAYVVDSRLKVMLDEEYFISRGQPLSEKQSVTGMANDVIKTFLLPLIEREVNEGPMFEPLRRIYDVLILAKWYKMRTKGNLLSAGYVNGKKMAGLEGKESNASQTVYEKYMELFSLNGAGVLAEAYDPVSQGVVSRQYFSGGIQPVVDPAMLRQAASTELRDRPVTAVSVDLAMINSAPSDLPQQVIIASRVFQRTQETKRSGTELLTEYVDDQGETIFAGMGGSVFIRIYVGEGYDIEGGRRQIFKGYPQILYDEKTGLSFYGNILLSNPAYQNIQRDIPVFDFSTPYVAHYFQFSPANITEIMRFGLLPADQTGRGKGEDSFYDSVVAANIFMPGKVPQTHQIYFIVDPDQGYEDFQLIGDLSFWSDDAGLKGMRRAPNMSTYRFMDEAHSRTGIRPERFRGLIVNMNEDQWMNFLDNWKRLLNQGHVFNLPIYQGGTGELIYDQRLHKDERFISNVIRKKIEVYKWIASEKAREDIGLERAIDEWLTTASTWLLAFADNPFLSDANQDRETLRSRIRHLFDQAMLQERANISVAGRTFVYSRFWRDSYGNIDVEEYVDSAGNSLYVAVRDMPFLKLYLGDGNDIDGGVRPRFKSYPQIGREGGSYLYGDILWGNPTYQDQRNVPLFDFQSFYLTHYLNLSSPISITLKKDVGNLLAEVFCFGLLPAEITGRGVGDELHPQTVSMTARFPGEKPTGHELYIVIDPDQGYQDVFQAGRLEERFESLDLKGLQKRETIVPNAIPQEVQAQRISADRFRAVVVNLDPNKQNEFLTTWQRLLQEGYVFDVPIYEGTTGRLLFQRGSAINKAMLNVQGNLITIISRYIISNLTKKVGGIDLNRIDVQFEGESTITPDGSSFVLPATVQGLNPRIVSITQTQLFDFLSIR